MREGLKPQSRELFRWCFWLLLWELAARLLHNRLLLVGPFETLGILFRMALGASYWQAVWNSTLRVLGGFSTGALAGIGLAVSAEKREGLRWILSPFVNVIKAIPVASFVVILLIWVGNRNASLFICFFVSFPIFYLNTLAGLGATPRERLSRHTRIRALYLPVLAPFLESALSLSVGVSFKAGAAAELIGQPLLSFGNGLYRAKIYLETGEVFAWTLSIVLFAMLAEKLLSLLLRALISACAK